MIEGILSALLSALLSGGSSAIVALLAFICYGLWTERSRMVRQQQLSETRLDAVARAQTASTDRIVGAIAELRIALERRAQ